MDLPGSVDNGPLSRTAPLDLMTLTSEEDRDRASGSGEERTLALSDINGLQSLESAWTRSHGS